MKEDNLIQIWKEVHTGMKKETVDIERLLRERHCKILLKTERKLKRKTWFLSIPLAFTVISTALLWSVNLNPGITYYYLPLMLLIALYSNISHRRMLSATIAANDIRQSRIELKNRMKRVFRIEFIGYTILSVTYAIYLAIGYKIIYQPPFDFFDGFVIISIALLIVVLPWSIRYEQNRKYRTLFRALDKDIKILEEKENISTFEAQ